MLIDRHISPYIIFSEDTLISALQKISDNKSRIVFSVSENGRLEGILTDGDFRRWLLTQEEIDLNQSVSTASNKNFKSARIEDEPSLIESYFSEKIEFIPLLDDYGHLVAIAKQNPQGIKIGSYLIDSGSPTFIIAEIGNNHNGDFELAKKLIDEAASSGANCAKFQMRDLSSLYYNSGNANDIREDLGSQYTLDLLSRFQLSPEKMFLAFDYCKEKKILPLCTPWDLESLNLLEQYGMDAYKIASADLTNHDLLIALAKTKKPIICSTGMATEAEIEESVSLLKRHGAIYVLLHCNSTYPAPFKDVNLNYLETLKKTGDCLVGYSGHERGINVAIAAVAKGAKIIEKHFTLDKNMEGNDHKVSLLPQEFQAMVTGIREVEESLGSTAPRQLSQGELMNRENLAKSLIINCNLGIGNTITSEMIEVKSPGKGLQPNYKQKLIGLKARRAFKAGDFFFSSDLLSQQVTSKNYSFKRPWGLPVRYHDFQKILDKTNPDFLEFHLSYKDMDCDIDDFFKTSYDLDLVVHSPDLFSGDHILNLASTEEDHRRRSVKELQRVIDLTLLIKPFFKKATRPLIVASLGGFTKNGHVLPDDRDKLYQILGRSLSELNTDGIELLAQTLPPFPWYFGGQLYLNLFVTPDDTVDFCRRYGYRLCLDISHSKLSCNYYQLSFSQFIEKVSSYVAHLHIVDASGIDGEGLQIGEGEIDFVSLAENLDKYLPDTSFIPEIWQGHKNEGEGFWIALERLEKIFSS